MLLFDGLLTLCRVMTAGTITLRNGEQRALSRTSRPSIDRTIVIWAKLGSAVGGFGRLCWLRDRLIWQKQPFKTCIPKCAGAYRNGWITRECNNISLEVHCGGKKRLRYSAEEARLGLWHFPGIISIPSRTLLGSAASLCDWKNCDTRG